PSDRSLPGECGKVQQPGCAGTTSSGGKGSMTKWLLAGLLAFSVGSAYAGDKFENKSAGISVDVPAGFTTATEVPATTELGQTLGAYKGPNVDDTGAVMLVHMLEIPGCLDYDNFKNNLPDLLKTLLGEKFKLIKQEDAKVDQMTGFMLDFQGPGDGKLPNPSGNILHHVRWYF